jgi:hypothetical protein
VSWINGVTPYATSYNVYAYIVGTDVLVGFQNAPTSPYIYTGLLPNYAYYFTIKGVNATGEGEAGAPRALEILRDEVRRTMHLYGARSIDEVTPDLLA